MARLKEDVLNEAKGKIEFEATSAVYAGLQHAYEGGVANGQLLHNQVASLQERNDWQASQLILLGKTLSVNDVVISELKKQVATLVEQKRRMFEERSKPTPILSVSQQCGSYCKRFDIVRILGSADGLHIEVI